ncbi:hypothetical protein [Streptomyces sp. URMC 129]|uniref:hypothetical protein n=1 Tax=Streptomyces sp. URMC 129 TaxID=3423407 RepID=UPI003F1B9FB5
MTDTRGVCASSATHLASDVPYVRGRADAHKAASALAEQLRALDLEEVFPGLMADVTVNGDGVVQLGHVRPVGARFLATLIVAGLTTELMQDTGLQASPDLPCRSPSMP